MQEDPKRLVLVHLIDGQELRGFAQQMRDGRWAPRASVVRHRDSEDQSFDTPLVLGDVTFETEQEAAEYGLERLVAWSADGAR